MNEFDSKAQGWDLNPMHLERSVAIVSALMKRIPVSSGMNALEYGAGTGITGFLLKDHLKEITMIDSSAEMVRIMKEKINASGAVNLKAHLFDLEKDEWNKEKFDLVITQMVLHHVADINGLISKFSGMIKQGGFLAIADLYSEDGSFHGEGFTGHNGFDPGELAQKLAVYGFADTEHDKCFVVNKKIDDNSVRGFNVFLLTARKS